MYLISPDLFTGGALRAVDSLSQQGRHSDACWDASFTLKLKIIFEI